MDCEGNYLLVTVRFPAPEPETPELLAEGDDEILVQPFLRLDAKRFRADFGDLSVVSAYHPSGSSGELRQAFKMEWLDDYQKYVDELKKTRPHLILSGDYNICHKPIDIHDPVRSC